MCLFFRLSTSQFANKCSEHFCYFFLSLFVIYVIGSDSQFHSFLFNLNFEFLFLHCGRMHKGTVKFIFKSFFQMHSAQLICTVGFLFPIYVHFPSKNGLFCKSVSLLLFQGQYFLLVRSTHTHTYYSTFCLQLCFRGQC